MTRWLITEKCEYLVAADSEEEAEALFLEHGPSMDTNEDRAPLGVPVSFVGVVERMVETADD